MLHQVWRRFEGIAKVRGAAPAILQGDECLSFEGLFAAAEAWAALLSATPGARVVVSGQNRPALAAAIPGIWRCGAIPVLVHADAPAGQMAHICTLTDPAAVLTDGDPARLGVFADRAVGISVPPKGNAGDPPEQGPKGNAGDPPEQGDDTPASIVFTSGSSGLPKGVVQSAGNLIGGVDRIAAHLGYRADDRILCPIPFAFDYGWGQLLSALLRGITIVLPEPRNAFGACTALSEHRPTVIAGVPAFFADLLGGLSPIRETPRDTVRLITNTGSKIPPHVFAALTRTFPDAEISLNYGLTETYRTASLPVSEAQSHSSSVGYPVPGVEIDVLRPDGTRAATGEEGEIVHRGAGTFLGYYGDPDRTAEVLRPDPRWTSGSPPPKVVYTGDLGRLDAEGRLYVNGRRDRQLKSMGVRVAPDEVETLLLESGLLDAAAITSRPNDTLGDMIVAFVVAKPGSDADTTLRALKKHARATMSPYMQPRQWHISHSLPLTPGGKVDYPLLRRIAQGETADA